MLIKCAPDKVSGNVANALHSLRERSPVAFRRDGLLDVEQQPFERHLTRVVDSLPSLRCKRFLDDLRESLLRARKRDDFRVVHYSVQHIHLVIEADGHEAMGRGMRSLSARISWAVRRVFRVIGSVMAGRYHVRWLKTPTERATHFATCS